MRFALKTFTLFERIAKVRLEDISQETRVLLAYLADAREKLTEELLKKINYHQTCLEELLEKNYSFHYQLYHGVLMGLKLRGQTTKLLN
ncbi:hypothetical protein HOF92_10045 [bacterium]|jgi:hypothetical protein|nr:hypothetical protein [bacterium]